LLANAAKHACASVVWVAVEEAYEDLYLSIRDNGVGGADPARGSGLVGIEDRVEAMGGTIVIASQIGAGTAVSALLPLEHPDAVRW
jgi:signal transduction histidine kinase